MAGPLEFGGYPADDPRNNPGKGWLRKKVTGIVDSISSKIGTPATSEPVFDLSGPIAAVKSWDARNRTQTIIPSDEPQFNNPQPIPGSIPALSPLASHAPGSITLTSSPTSPPPLPSSIKGRTVTQNADGSGVISAGKVSRKTPGAAPAIAQDASTTPPITQPVESAGYGEYTGDPSSRILAGPAATPNAPLQVAAAPTPQTSTIGYAHGVYELAPGQNAPPDFNNTSLGDMAGYKFKMNQALKQSQIAGQGAASTHLMNQDQMAAAELPSKIEHNKAVTRSLNTGATIAGMKAPVEIEGLKSATDLHKANTLDIINMMDPKKNNLLSEVGYRNGMLKVAQDKLGILKDQITLRSQQQQKGDSADWGGISKFSLEAIKLLDAKAALGALTPEEAQLRKNYQDTFNTAFVKQKRTGYQPKQILADAGDE
jgi:hypothetical protein